MTEQTELTIGQKLCGVAFNPGGNEHVAVIKQAFAEALDKIIEVAKEASPGQTQMFDKAINDLITAQMWAVKATTWSHS